MNRSPNPSIPSEKKVAFLLRLGLSILILNVLVLVIVGLLLNKSRLLYKERAGVSTQSLAKVLGDNIDNYLDKIDFCLSTIEYEAEIHLAAGKFNNRVLDPFIQRSHTLIPELESLRIADAHGDVILGVGIVKRVNIADRDYFLKLRNNPGAGLVIAKPLMSRMSGKWVLNIARRLDDPDGSFAGIVYAQLALANFSEMFSNIDIGNNGTITLRDGDLGFIIRYPASLSSESMIGQKQISLEFTKMLAVNREAGTYFTPKSIIDSLPRTFSYLKTPHYPLYVVVGRATTDYLEDWESDSMSSLFLVAAFIVTTLISAWVLYRKWQKQMMLTEELRKSKGELETRVAERTAELHEKTVQLEEMNRTLGDRVQNSVTELRAKDKMLIQQSRQAAMGEMIDNIAHQWKQPLNNLGLLIQSVKFDFADGVLTKEDMSIESGKCMDLITFMAQTIEDFRSFFREDKQKIDFEVAQSISRAARLVSASLEDRRIRIIIEHGDDIQINGYPNEYAQVLLNLLGNARDVLVERRINAPVITVHVMHEDDQAIVTVSDNGGGIADDIIGNIFDPYFTTKERGIGTGIGLFMSKIIIEEHMGGSLTVSNKDDGAQFKIVVAKQ